MWQYEPIKYWPNDNNPADDQGATGSQAHSYLSFFAYAPYVNGTVTLNATDYHFDNSTGRVTSDSEPATYYDAQSAATGILGLSGNTATGGPKVHFRSNTSDLVN